MTAPSARPLDFVVIGAQKSGTTSLFKYLSEHEKLCLPADKEAEFFNDPARHRQGWDWYLSEFFPDARADQLLGTVTPQYMGYPGVAKRLSAQCPAAKLIAILRDPIERAYSHHRMNQRWGIAPRSFEEEVARQLAQPARWTDPCPQNSHVEWGEYGKILSEFLEHFPRNQLLVLYTTDLERDPAGVLERTCAFLDVATIRPTNVGRRYHQGGTRQRAPRLKPFVKNSPLRHLLDLLPTRTRRRWAYWYTQWNVVPEKPGPIPLSPDLLANLREHYRADGERLSAILGESPPWLPDYQPSS